MFLPTTRAEMQSLGWNQLDVILVTGDTYIDSPYIGVAVIGKLLHQAGFRVGIIAQPSPDSAQDISRLGEPALFWGVSGGSIDSMVANYTAGKKRRQSDDYTPGGQNTRRPDRAAIFYTNLIKRFFKSNKPIVLGGVEASLRRIAHYDYWSDSLRKSILFDAKADLLVYGMAERAIVELAHCLKAGTRYQTVRGICYIASEKPEDFLELPSFAAVSASKEKFIEMFHLFYRNNDPITAQGLAQLHDTRYLIQNPPASALAQTELDALHALDFERAVHPFYLRQGRVKALETIKFSITTHRGCYGECNFCAIAVHQGRTVQWRSEESILAEAEKLAGLDDFKGIIQDVGGPTANMYGFECARKLKLGSCPDKRCLFPRICPSLKINHQAQIRLLKKLRKIPEIRKVFVASGVRYDLLLEDKKSGFPYLQELAAHHISGQMKVAPEHSEESVLQKMGKPGKAILIQFKKMFDRATRAARKDQYLTYYLIAAHPGCNEADMRRLKDFTSSELQINPEQVQLFIPAPSTYSSVMYYTEMDPFTGKKTFVEKNPLRREQQKQILVEKGGWNRRKS